MQRVLKGGEAYRRFEEAKIKHNGFMDRSNRKELRLESGEAILSFSKDQDNQSGTFSGYIRKYETEVQKEFIYISSLTILKKRWQKLKPKRY